MALFFDLQKPVGPNDDDKRLFQEAEPAGGGKDNDTSTTDYTDDKDAADGDDSGAAKDASNGDGGDDPSDSPEDYTLNDDGTTGDSGEDQNPSEADNNPPEEGSEGGGDDMGGGDDGMGMASDGDGSGGGGGSEGDEGGGDDPEGSGGDDFGNDDDDYGDGGGGENPDKIKELEDELFADFNAAQRTIMTRTLKKKYNKLFLMCDDIIERINDIPKAMEHIQAIEFVSLKLTEIKDMLSDYLYYTFNTKTYTENEIQYKRYIALLTQIDRFISKIPTIKPDKG